MQFRWLFFPLTMALLWYYTSQKLRAFEFFRSKLGTALIVLLFLWMNAWQFTYRLNLVASDTFLFNFLVWGGSLTLGAWATFLLFCLPTDAILWLRGRLTKNREISNARRQFFTRQLPVTFGGTATLFSGLGFYQASTGPQIREIQIPIPNLPDELVGFKIAQISDLHVGPTIRREYVETVVQRTLALQPDLIAVTGDLVDGIPEWLKPHMEPLGQLRATHGVYYCTGNHEYYWGAESWIQKTIDFGWTPLINESRLITHQGHSLVIAGVSDTSAHQFIPNHKSNPFKAMPADGKSAPLRLLLAHRPDSCFEAEKAGFNLQLSGHTHAGQFFPWNLLVRLAHKYPSGLNQHGGLSLYVNAGTGYWGPAHRLGIPSEITLVTLAKHTLS
jgi:predicted MPP superfamily phosphohydrolase